MSEKIKQIKQCNQIHVIREKILFDLFNYVDLNVERIYKQCNKENRQ